MKYIVLCLAALCASTLAFSGAPKWPRLPLELLLSGKFKIEKSGDKIVGGEAAKEGEIPFIASMRNGNTHSCGASILSNNKVLTAAHCTVDVLLIGRLSIAAEGLDRTNLAQVRSVREKVEHPGYNSNTFDNDVSVLTLSEDLIFGPLISAVNLAVVGSTPSADTEVVVAGWGTIREGGILLPALLQKVNVSIISSENCQNKYTNNVITENMICAGVNGGGKDSCQGDSGGPLFLSSNNIQVGIVSWGIGCAQAEYPGVYSNVATLRTWIDEQMAAA